MPSPAVEERRRLRAASGLLQAEAAARAGISQAALSMWESGTRPLAPETESRLVAVLESTALAREADERRRVEEARLADIGRSVVEIVNGKSHAATGR